MFLLTVFCMVVNLLIQVTIKRMIDLRNSITTGSTVKSSSKL